jgi:hypothetical protein
LFQWKPNSASVAVTSRLLLLELNPDPLADNLSQLNEAGRFLLQEQKHLLSGQFPIRPAAGEIDRREFRTLWHLCWNRCGSNGISGLL